MHRKNCKLSLLNTALMSGLLLVSALSAQSQSDVSRSGQWRIAGQNLNNTWSQPAEHSISPANVKGLKPKWVFTTGGDVSATPTVAGDAVYFPDWAGNLFAVNKHSGGLMWSHKISDYDGVPGAISRVSPAVDHDQLIIGDILSSKETHPGANVMQLTDEQENSDGLGTWRLIQQPSLQDLRLSSTGLFTSVSLRTKKLWRRIPRIRAAASAAV